MFTHTCVIHHLIQQKWELFAISGNDLLGGGPDLVLTVGTITPNRTALDLAKSVNKLTDGSYLLADGVEGQIMHLVRQDNATSDQVNLMVAHGRVNGLVYPDILYTPFTFNSLPNDLITLIFTDNAWQSNNGAWD